MTYSVHRADGFGMVLSDLRVRPTVHFEVRWDEDGAIAFRTRQCFADQGRSIAGLRVHANNVCKRFQAYWDRYGKRYEVEHREKVKKDRTLNSRLARLKWLRENVPKLARELALLEEEMSGTTPADETVKPPPIQSTPTPPTHRHH